VNLGVNCDVAYLGTFVKLIFLLGQVVLILMVKLKYMFDVVFPKFITQFVYAFIKNFLHGMIQMSFTYSKNKGYEIQT